MIVAFNSQTNAFENIMAYVQSFPTQCTMSEQEDKLILTLKPVNNLQKAIEILAYLQVN
jgi:hypothetical protein